MTDPEYVRKLQSGAISRLMKSHGATQKTYPGARMDIVNRLLDAGIPETLISLGATENDLFEAFSAFAYIPTGYARERSLETEKNAKARRLRLGKKLRELSELIDADQDASRITVASVEDDGEDWCLKFARGKLLNRPTISDILVGAADVLDKSGPYSFEIPKKVAESRYTWRCVLEILVLTKLLPGRHRRNKIIAEIASAVLNKRIKGNDLAKDPWMREALAPARREWKMVKIS